MDEMPATSTNINAKIAFLCGRAGIGPSELARIAEVTPASAAAYLKASMPSGPSLARIADHFAVSVRWLLDDDAPIEAPQTDVERLSDEQLAEALAARFREVLEQVGGAVTEAEAIDWRFVNRRLSKGSLDELIGPDPANPKDPVAAVALRLISSLVWLSEAAFRHFRPVGLGYRPKPAEAKRDTLHEAVLSDRVREMIDAAATGEAASRTLRHWFLEGRSIGYSEPRRARNHSRPVENVCELVRAYREAGGKFK